MTENQANLGIQKKWGPQRTRRTKEKLHRAQNGVNYTDKSIALKYKKKGKGASTSHFNLNFLTYTLI